MDICEFVIEAKKSLLGCSDVLQSQGTVLYSSYKTLCKGKLYTLGLNPGGKPSQGYTVEDELDRLPSKIDNSYYDESWNGSGVGQSKLQVRIKYLLEEVMGCDLRKVCSSNLIFSQTKCANDLPKDIANKCWPIHELILNVVQPTHILVFGNSSFSPYSFLMDKFLNPHDINISFSAKHGIWKIKTFKAYFDERIVHVLGMPHLSRYQPQGKEMIRDFLKHWYAQ